MRRVLVTIMVGTVLTLLAALPPRAEAQPNAARPGAISQFLAHQSNGRGYNFTNPTNIEHFVLAIFYDQNGNLDTDPNGAFDNNEGGCKGYVVPPHGATGDDTGDGDEMTLERNLVEVIAVATQGGLAGVFDRLGVRRLGVQARGRAPWHALPPSIFSPPTGADLTALTACACSELGNYSLSSTLLADAGITCP